VGVVAVAVGHAFDDLDLAVDAHSIVNTDFAPWQGALDSLVNVVALPTRIPSKGKCVRPIAVPSGNRTVRLRGCELGTMVEHSGGSAVCEQPASLGSLPALTTRRRLAPEGWIEAFKPC